MEYGLDLLKRCLRFARRNPEKMFLAKTTSFTNIGWSLRLLEKTWQQLFLWVINLCLIVYLCCYCERNFPASVGLPGDNKVHNKFKNNNKNGNFAFKCCWWPVGVCCLSAKICCSWSSTNLRNVQLASFFNSALFLLLVGSGPKRSMPIGKLAVFRSFLPHFREKEKCTAA